ncbi:hypothetical protein [Microbacterium lemovicicum]|uniref:hypothetical protein n=1 Tax=Microbacterium lemovicicum TaxID=1072463 RepID=UPI0019D1CE72
MVLTVAVDPRAERASREPLIEPRPHPDRIERVAGEPSGRGEVFDVAMRRLVAQLTGGDAPRGDDDLALRLRIVLDRRIAQTAPDGVVLVTRQVATGEPVDERREPRRAEDSCVAHPGAAAGGSSRSTCQPKILADRGGPTDVGPRRARQRLDEIGAGAVSETLRQPVVAP